MGKTFASVACSVVILALSACGVSDGDDDDDNGYTLLFSDNFDGGFPTGSWNITGPSASFVIDNSTGGFSPPSLQVEGGTSASAQVFANPFDAVTGLRFLVGVRLPPTGGAAGINGIPLVEIVRESTGQSAARLELNIGNSPNEASFAYFLPGRTNTEPATLGQFFAFSFTVNPDGTSNWARNGINVADDSSTALAGEIFRLRIHAVGVATWDVNYDDVEVRKY